jgi:hypothetical protein
MILNCGAGPPDTRVLRGGAFNNNQHNARCAYRNNNHPDNRNDNIGFRVVVSHDSHRMPEMRLSLRTEPPRQRLESRTGSGPGRLPYSTAEAGEYRTGSRFVLQ